MKKEMKVQQVKMRSMMKMMRALKTSQGTARPLLLVMVLIVSVTERAMFIRQRAERMIRMTEWLLSTQLTAAQTDLPQALQSNRLQVEFLVFGKKIIGIIKLKVGRNIFTTNKQNRRRGKLSKKI